MLLLVYIWVCMHASLACPGRVPGYLIRCRQQARASHSCSLHAGHLSSAVAVAISPDSLSCCRVQCTGCSYVQARPAFQELLKSLNPEAARYLDELIERKKAALAARRHRVLDSSKAETQSQPPAVRIWIALLIWTALIRS